MYSMKDKLLAEFDNYVEKSNTKEIRKLTKQKKDGIIECRRVLTMLKKKKMTFKEEMKTIEKKMIPYIGRMKWMPWSFRNMLSEWEDRFLELGGK